jgi:DNA (cytosine-5)-methyltransferase 1
VFVVASSRDGFNPTEVLFEFEGVRRDSAPSRETRKEIASAAGTGFTASSFAGYREGVGTLRSSGGDLGGGSETLAVMPTQHQVLGSGKETIGCLGASQGQKLWLGNQEAFSGDFHIVVHGTQDPCTSESTAFALGRNNGQENVVCQSFQQNASINEALCFTQTKADIHAVAYSFDSLSSNSMKSNNPNSGCNEVDLAKTLDTSCLNPACNQGGMAVAYAVHENQRSEVKLTGSVGTIRCGEGKSGHGYSCAFTSDGDGVIPSVLSYGIPGNWIGRKPENGGNATEPMHDIAPCQTKTDVHAVACFSAKDYGADVTDNLSPTLRAGNHNTSHANSGNWMAVHVPFMSIRRLTPTECERLQGFPDGYTDIKPNGKPTPDGPRYKALGNSWAVPVVRWIGMRIQNSLNHKE